MQVWTILQHVFRSYGIQIMFCYSLDAARMLFDFSTKEIPLWNVQSEYKRLIELEFMPNAHRNAKALKSATYYTQCVNL